MNCCWWWCFVYVLVYSMLYASWFGVYIFRGFLYLGALMVWGFFGLGFYIVFLISCWFDVFLIFWGFLFLDFLMLFWWFFDFSTIFFRGFLTAITHQNGYIFWNSLAILFFSCIMAGVMMRWPVTSHRARFTALRLVFNRICIGVCDIRLKV